VLAMPLVWDQLTHLTLKSTKSHRGFSLGNVIVLLGRCTRLVSFHVTLTPILVDNGLDSTSGTLLLPFLETFILDEGSATPQSLNRLIEHVSMPQLRTFSATTDASTGSESFFLVPLGTGSPLIENLTIWLPSLTKQSLPETLRSFPSLTKLVVLDGPVWDWESARDPEFEPTVPMQLLELLTPNLETALCPALQELVVRTCNVVEKSMLAEFIHGRMDCEFTAGFKRLEIVLQNLISSELELMSDAEIQSHLSRGLDISLVYSDYWDSPRMLSPWAGLPPEI